MLSSSRSWTVRQQSQHAKRILLLRTRLIHFSRPSRAFPTQPCRVAHAARHQPVLTPTVQTTHTTHAHSQSGALLKGKGMREDVGGEGRKLWPALRTSTTGNPSSSSSSSTSRPPAQTSSQRRTTAPLGPKSHLHHHQHIITKLHKLFDRPLSSGQSLLTRAQASKDLSTLFSNRDQTILIAERLACSKKPAHALALLSLAKDLNLPIHASAYERVAHSLSLSSHWSLIPPCITQCKAHTGRLTTRLLNWKSRASLEMQDYTSLLGSLEEFKKEGLVPNRRTYHLLISGCIRNCDLDGARGALRAMERAGLERDAETHSILSSVSMHLAPDEKVMRDALASLGGATPQQATMLLNTQLQGYMYRNDLEGLRRITGLFDQANIDCGIGGSVIEDLTPAVCEGEKPAPLLESPSVPMPPFPIQPNATTFHHFAEYSARRYGISRTLRMVERMQAAGFAPDSRALGSLIKASLTHGDPSTALGIAIRVCRNAGVNSSSWGELTPSPDASPELPSLDYDHVKPTIDLFVPLFQGLLTTHSMDKAYAVLEIMKHLSIGPSSRMIHILLSHLERSHNARPLLLIRILRRLTSGTVQPSLKHLHIILRSVIRREKAMVYGKGWHSTASRFHPGREDSTHRPHNPARLTRALEDNFDPSAGIGVPTRAPYRRALNTLLSSLSSRNLNTSSSLIALRLRRDAITHQDISQASEVFRTLLARGLKPQPQHFAAIMEGCTIKGDMFGAEEVFREYTKAGFAPNVVMFTILISGYAKQGKPRMAVKTFQRMVSHNVKPDVASIDAVICAFFAVGALLLGKQMLVSLWPYVGPVPAGVRGMSLGEMAMRLRGLGDAGREVRRDLERGQKMMMYMRVNKLMKQWSDSGGEKSMMAKAPTTRHQRPKCRSGVERHRVEME